MIVELTIILCAALVAEAWYYDYLRDYNERMGYHGRIG